MDESNHCEETEVYHERQVKELCALHALNNLFQKKHTFTKKELDEICNRLSPDSFINPHRSVLGMGNYDVNVLMAALQEKGYETVWFDKRKDVDVLLLENIMGLILNTPTEYRLGFIKLPIHRKHWIAIRYLHGQFMNLDSKLDGPKSIGDEADLLSFLRSELSDGDKELLLVVEPNVSEKALWKKKSIDCDPILSDPTEATGTTPDNGIAADDTVVETNKAENQNSVGVVQNGIKDISIQDTADNSSDREPNKSLQSLKTTEKEVVDSPESQVKS